jgi:hypothetical protein
MVLGDFTHDDIIVDQRIENIVVEEPLENFKDLFSLQKWWAQILLNHGRYPCYAIPLLLRSNKEAVQYVKTFGREIDLISGENCLVIGLSKIKFEHFNIDLWGHIVDRKVHEECSIAISKLFGISFTQFPCLIIFEDIRSSNYIVITLKGMTVEEISEVMLELFSIIQKAVSEKKNLLAAIEGQRKKERFRRGGQTIVSELCSLAEKTFEIIIEAWMKKFFK